jgi:SAM-dependent methyltransferase
MMSKTFSYQSYIKDEKFLDAYNAYQARYATQIRESDKKIISIVKDVIASAGQRSRVLDIGCSTGNLLLHMKGMIGDRAELVGGDLAESSLEICRKNDALSGVRFERLDILKLPVASYDVITANCVLYMMSDDQYTEALASIQSALRPGGSVLIYDFAHTFPQEIEIIEKTASHPEGLRLCFRSQKVIADAFRRAGFSSWDFWPFELPIDLPKIEHKEDIITYTRKDEHGARMAFRGTLYQPWCHMMARKTA